MAAAFVNVFGQVFRSALGVFAVHQVECDRQYVTGLRIALDPAVLCHISALEGGFDRSKKILISRGFFTLAESLCSLSQELRAVRETGRVDHILGSVGIDAEPVAET